MMVVTVLAAGCGAEVSFGSSGSGASGTGDHGGTGGQDVDCLGGMGGAGGSANPPGDPQANPTALLLETDCADVQELRVVSQSILSCDYPNAAPTGCGWWELRIALPLDYPFANQAKEQGTLVGFSFRETSAATSPGLLDCSENSGVGELKAAVILKEAGVYYLAGELVGFNDYLLHGKPDGHFNASACP